MTDLASRNERNLPSVQTEPSEGAPRTYRLGINRTTVDKLGVKLYDRASAAITELISNAYDADAKRVVVEAPMNRFLATKSGGTLQDQGLSIVITDNGNGMDQDEMQDFYLQIGRDRRADPRQGDRSPKLRRPVTGRKGVGKLAPFGICKTMEVRSAGGEVVPCDDGVERYRVSHIILNYDDIHVETRKEYEPKTGPDDGTLDDASGTTITLTNFFHKRVPGIEDLSRQIAQRFGLASNDGNWSVLLKDSEGDGSERRVTALDIPLLEETRIRLDPPADPSSLGECVVQKHDGTIESDHHAGIEVDGEIYPIKGWLGYSKTPYKDDVLSGVRIYCRRKFVARTDAFNRGAGFTGEASVRSYLVGELECDWLDDDEDLVRTDRQDIIWSSELGAALQHWGQEIVRLIGRIGRPGVKRRNRELFLERSKAVERIKEAFPTDPKIVARARELASALGGRMNEAEVDDQDTVEDTFQLVLMLAPHMALEQTFDEIEQGRASTVSAFADIVRVTRLAEVYSYGRIAEDRVRAIERLKTLSASRETDEKSLQKLIEGAPWLIEPQWAPISEDISFRRTKERLAKNLKESHNIDIAVEPGDYERKRCDFVLLNLQNRIEIVEIKKPKHDLENEEVARITNYVDAFGKLFEDEANAQLRGTYPNGFHITLVCDGEKVDNVHATALEGLKTRGLLHRINWDSFLAATEQSHRDFLAELARQKKSAAERSQ